jgi:hypothetical protein
MNSLSYREQIALKLFEWKSRYTRPASVLDFPEALTQSGSLLICLPEQPDEADEALCVIPELIALLKPHSCIVVGPSSMASRRESLDETVLFVSIRPEDRNWFGLPGNAFIRRITENRPVRAIDLNRSFNLFTAALCLNAGATVRMGFSAPQRHLFFNVQFSISRETPSGDHTGEESVPMPVSPHSDNIYRRLLQTIRMLSGKRSVLE